MSDMPPPKVVPERREVSVGSRAPRPSLRRGRILASVAGAAAAMLVFEVGLRPFLATWHGRPMPVREVRQYREGVAVSHFAQAELPPFGARLTGHPWIEGAPVGLVLGDSHVLASEVSDEATMGSVVEATYRAKGTPFNVRQYGWNFSAAPTYLAVADWMLQTWNPAWVVVVLNQVDLGAEPLRDAALWRMRILPDLSVELVPVGSEESPAGRDGPGRWSAVVGAVLQTSALADAAASRYADIRAAARQERTPKKTKGRGGRRQRASGEVANVPLATIRALRKAYGTRLVVVYTPYLPVVRGEAADPSERALVEACRAEQVPCVSVRSAMAAARDECELLTRGFHNTAPGEGHLNETGHRIVAEAIWRAVGGAADDAAE